MGKVGRITTDATGSSVMGVGADVASKTIVPMLLASGQPKPPGWRSESYRHSLAARGIKTSYTFNMKAGGVIAAPDFIVKNEILNATKVPKNWELVKLGYTGDNVENEKFRYELWSTVFKNRKDGEEVKYYYIIRSMNDGNKRFSDPVVEDRTSNYQEAIQWFQENKKGEFHYGERP